MSYGRSRRSKTQLGQYKSKLEVRCAELLSSRATYEPDRLPFVQPAKQRYYIPDFKLREKVYIEAKGRLTIEDRQKMLWVKEQHPDCTFYLLFGNAQNKLNKKSKTTYAMWAEANGFEWADVNIGIPHTWLKGAKRNGRTTSKTTIRRRDTKT